MKTIVAGSRNITSLSAVRAALFCCPWEITEVVSGTARGVDQLGERVAQELGLPVKRFPADWSSLGSSAGPVRNIQMAHYADALVAIWDGHSTGTKHMIDTATLRGLRVFVIHPDEALNHREHASGSSPQTLKRKRPRFT